MYRLTILLTAVFLFETLFAAPNVNEKPENSENSTIREDDDQRIINGIKAAPGQYPFMCSIQTHVAGGVSEFCAGSLIHRKWILTAAHCMVKYRNGRNVDELRVACGSTHSLQYVFHPETTTAQVMNINKVYVHSNFKNEVGSGPDIALLEFTKPIDLNKWVQPISLAPVRYNPVGKMGKNMGWGSIDPTDISKSTYELMVGPGYVLDSNECTRKYGWRPFDYEICVFHKDSSGCAGDSGSPHIHTMENGQVVQVGIMSYGSVHDCSKLPVIFTKVSSFLPWIQDIFRQNFQKYDLPK